MRGGHTTIHTDGSRYPESNLLIVTERYDGENLDAGSRFSTGWNSNMP